MAGETVNVQSITTLIAVYMDESKCCNAFVILQLGLYIHRILCPPYILHDPNCVKKFDEVHDLWLLEFETLYPPRTNRCKTGFPRMDNTYDRRR